MKYINFNGYKISKLSLGTVQFGLDYGISNQSGKPTQDQVKDIIKYVISEGINCFDTAQAYGNSEEVLGASIDSTDELLLISKLKSNIFEENAISSLEMSIKNLKVKKLFSLLLHDATLLYDWKDKYSDIVAEIKRKNLSIYFGASIYSSDEFDLAIDNKYINFIQIPFNIFDQRAIKENWFERAKSANKLVFIRSIYLQGLLLMDKMSVSDKLPIAIDYVEKLDYLCDKYKLTRNELSLSFVDKLAPDSLLLFGCDNIEQAKENIKNYNNLVELDNKLIQEAFDLFSNIPENIFNPTKW